MGFRRGFKTEANSLGEEIRAELGLSSFDALEPRALAEHLLIPIWDLSDLCNDHAAIRHLLTQEPEQFSAITVFRGTQRTIVHNNAHTPGRQNNNLTHELAHGLLGHPPTPALDNHGCREWNPDVEDEANWLAGVLLVPEPATIAIAKGQWTKAVAATLFGVSEPLIQMRLNQTGAVRRVERLRRYQ